MPKITINVPKYTAVPFTKGYLELKGGLSHGWFDQFVKNTWLHHKYLYIQLGGNLPVHVYYIFIILHKRRADQRTLTIGKPASF